MPDGTPEPEWVTLLRRMDALEAEGASAWAEVWRAVARAQRVDARIVAVGRAVARAIFEGEGS